MVAPRRSSPPPDVDLWTGVCCLLPERVASGRGAADTEAPGQLTPAEARVRELILAGLSNKEIAAVLGRAEPTIKNQVAAILRKHRVPSRTRLIAACRG